MRYVLIFLIVMLSLTHAADWYCYTQLNHTAVCMGPIHYEFCK